MRAVGKALGRILIVLVLLIAAVGLFGPREPAPLSASFDDRKFGEGVQVYFESVEANFDDITPGTEKRVVWQPGREEQRTPVSLLYIHGYSATSEEIRPVPDQIAAAMGANLVYTRLTGHGRDGAAMADATVADWMQDVAEGLAAARAVGETVIVMSTSTGGTLAAAAALDRMLSDRVAAMIFVSPNFRIQSAGQALLKWPAGRTWLPWLIGPTRSWEPYNAAHGTYWTTTYPTEAVLPMAAVVKAVESQDFSNVAIPALFWFSLQDTVVSPEATQAFAARWGGPVAIQNVTMGPGDDPDSHVVAGDIMSPGQTDATVSGMLEWLGKTLPSP